MQATGTKAKHPVMYFGWTSHSPFSKMLILEYLYHSGSREFYNWNRYLFWDYIVITVHHASLNTTLHEHIECCYGIQFSVVHMQRTHFFNKRVNTIGLVWLIVYSFTTKITAIREWGIFSSRLNSASAERQWLARLNWC